MHATDIVGYAFDGATYCTEHIKNPPECECEPEDRDAYGICENNCHGYGPNPIFAGDEDWEGEVCDVCRETLADVEGVV